MREFLLVLLRDSLHSSTDSSRFAHQAHTKKLYRIAFGVPDPTASDGSYIIPSIWLSLWSASAAIGSILGAVIAGWCQDALGRRWTFGLSGVVQAAAITISYFADQASTIEGRGAIYFIGKTAQGVALAPIMSTAQSYMSEVLPPALRGSVLSLFVPFDLLGQILGGLIIKSQAKILLPAAYRMPIALQWLFSAIPLLVAAFLPESPVWLMRRGCWTQAENACRRLEGSATASTADSTYNRLRVEVLRESANDENRGDASYLDLFRRRSDARRSMIVVFASLVPEFFGLTLLSHFTYFVELIGMKSSIATLLFIAGCLAGLISSCIAFFAMTGIGRRPLLVISLTIITVLWAAVGFSGLSSSPSVPW